MVSYLSSILGKTKTATIPPVSPKSPTSPSSPAKGKMDRLWDFGNEQFIALGKREFVEKRLKSYFENAEVDLKEKLAKFSKEIPPYRFQVAKVTALLITSTLEHQIFNSKLDPERPFWTDKLHKYTVAQPLSKHYFKKFEAIIRDCIFVNLLNAFDNTCKKIGAHEKNEAFMANLGTVLLDETIKHLESIKAFNNAFKEQDVLKHQAEMVEQFRNAHADLYPPHPSSEIPVDPKSPPIPEEFFIQLSKQMLAIAFPIVITKNKEESKEESKEEPISDQANALDIPDFFDTDQFATNAVKLVLGVDRQFFWSVINDVVPDVLQSIYKEATTKHSLNLMLLASLEKISEPQPTPAQPAKPVPKDELQTHLNQLSGKMIDAFFDNIPETLASKLLGIAFVKRKASGITGAIIREQLQQWNLTKIIDTGIESGLSSLHPGKWSDGDPKQFFPQRPVFNSNGMMMRDAAGKPILEDAPEFKFNFPVTEQDKVRDAAENHLEAIQVDHVLKQKLDKFLNEYAGGWLAIGMAKPWHLLLNVLAWLVKVVLFALCICAMGLPFLIWGWAAISKKITDAIMAPQKLHLVTQRNRIIKLLHEPVHGTLFRRIASIGVKAVAAPVL